MEAKLIPNCFKCQVGKGKGTLQEVTEGRIAWSCRAIGPGPTPPFRGPEWDRVGAALASFPAV